MPWLSTTATATFQLFFRASATDPAASLLAVSRLMAGPYGGRCGGGYFPGAPRNPAAAAARRAFGSRCGIGACRSLSGSGVSVPTPRAAPAIRVNPAACDVRERPIGTYRSGRRHVGASHRRLPCTTPPHSLRCCSAPSSPPAGASRRPGSPPSPGRRRRRRSSCATTGAAASSARATCSRSTPPPAPATGCTPPATSTNGRR